MRANKITAAMASFATFVLSTSPVLAAGATGSATRSATRSGLPEAGVADTTIILFVAASLLVFVGTIGLLSKKSVTK